MIKHIARRKQFGFTLLEVLIAIAIFAVISLASVSIFDTTIASETTSKERMARINELQRAFLLIERDFLQLTKRSIRFNGEQPARGFIHSSLEGFGDNEESIAFVRQGWTNPGLLIARSEMQSVGYRINEEVLERLHYNFVDPVLGEEPKIRPLITGVTQMSFEYFYGNKWRKTLNGDALPMAIAMEIETKDFGMIKRKFLIAGDPMVITQ